MNIIALPVRALRLADRSVRRAVTNAGDAAAALAAGNAQRRALSPLTTSDGAAHGELVRLSRDESLRLLRTRCVGHFAHVESARALSIVPVNYVLTVDDVVLFRSGPGPKLASADRGDVVAFQVDDIDNDLHVGWSVLVVGHARRLTWPEADRLVDQPEPWATGPRTQVVAITPSRIDGRRLL
jgi:nitroimidazol reductase NimA-like FMN-containing flavoprotein (pyridoxamine 5'-phosphate oxidase superfamily)